jgi:AcrR family transcriptional regulator
MSQTDPIDDQQSKSREQSKNAPQRKPVDSKKKQAGSKKKQANSSSRDIEALILTTAALLMPDYGYSRLTMRDLAEGAGIGLGTVYGYFQSKEEIGVQLVTRGIAAIHQEMEGILALSLEPAACLRHLLVARVMLRQKQTQGQRHPINERTPELLPALEVRRGGWYQQEKTMIARAISGWEDRLQVAPGSADYYAPTLLWATNGLVEEALQPLASKSPPYLATEAKSLTTLASLSVVMPNASAVASKDSSLDASRLATDSFSTDNSPAVLELKIIRVSDLLVAGIKRT